MDPLRVLIADDHPLFRHGINRLLSTVDDIEVVGEAENGKVVMNMVTSLQPDVVIMDIQMPDLNGIETTRHLRQISPHIRVLIVTMFDDDASVFAAMRAGARGYVLKDARKETILRAIRTIGRGEAIFSPTIASRMIDFFSSIRVIEPAEAFTELTEREVEVLDLIARGMNNTEIAEQLVLSPTTIRNYISNIYSKLQVADRAQAIIRARQAGMGKEGPSEGPLSEEEI